MAVGVAGCAWWEGWALPGFWSGNERFWLLVTPSGTLLFLAVDASWITLTAAGSRLAAVALLLGAPGPRLLLAATVDGWMAWGERPPTRCAPASSAEVEPTGVLGWAPMTESCVVGVLPVRFAWCAVSGRATDLAILLRGRPPHAIRVPDEAELAALAVGASPFVDDTVWRALFPALAEVLDWEAAIEARTGIDRQRGDEIPDAWARVDAERIALFWPDHTWIGSPTTEGQVPIVTRDKGASWVAE